jgi:hypothetical protein
MIVIGLQAVGLNLIKYVRHGSRTTPIRQAHSKMIGETYELIGFENKWP